MTIERQRHSIQRAIGPDRLWVGSQFLLFGAIVIAGPLDARRQRQSRDCVFVLAAVAGILLIAGGGAIARRAKRDLAGNFSMSPSPLDDGDLVDRGVYGVVRHPMYLSVLLFASGYSIAWRSRLAVIGTLGAGVFLMLKIRHEERRLMERYPGYRAYARRVRSRLIPRLF